MAIDVVWEKVLRKMRALITKKGWADAIGEEEEGEEVEEGEEEEGEKGRQVSWSSYMSINRPAF